MKLEHLEYLLAVTNAPSISVAAQRLYISQTALSAAIRSLENELQTEIFQRSSKGVRLTAEGERICAVAEEIVEKYHSLFSGRRPEKRSLSVGVYAYDYNALSMCLLKQLNENGCSVQLNISEVQENEVVSRLIDGDMDIGVGVAFADRHLAYQSLAKANGLRFEVLCEDQAYLYVSGRSALAEEQSVRLEDLREEQFVTTVNNFKPFKDAGFHRRIPKYCILSNTAAVIQSIVENNTVTLLPQRTMRDNPFLRGGTIRQIPIENVSSRGTHYVVYRPARLTAPEQLLVEAVRVFYQT